MNSEHSTTARWIRLGVNFEEGGNRSTRRKPLKSGSDRLKLNPHTTFVVEVEGVIDVQYASLTSQGVQHRVFYLELSKFRAWDSLVEGSLFLKPFVSLGDRRSNVSSSQKSSLSVFTLIVTPSVFQTALTQLLTCCLRRNSLEGKSMAIGLPVTYRSVYTWVCEKFACSDSRQANTVRRIRRYRIPLKLNSPRQMYTRDPLSSQ